MSMASLCSNCSKLGGTNVAATPDLSPGQALEPVLKKFRIAKLLWISTLKPVQGQYAG